MKNIINTASREHVETAIDLDRQNTEESFAFPFAHFLFKHDFDWRAQIFDLRYSLKEAIKLLSKEGVSKIIKEKNLGLEDATENFLRLDGFLSNLEHDFEDTMELFTLLVIDLDRKVVEAVISEYKKKIKMKEIENSEAD
jgi:hypothetical protein